MRVDVLTIFPEYLAPLELSLVGRARAAGIIDLRVHDLRDWTSDRHRTVDDSPFGGGAGMVMRPDVWGLALDDVLGGAGAAPDAGGRTPDAAGTAPDAVGTTSGGVGTDGDGLRLLVPTPAGRPFDQATAVELAGCSRLVIACGRYEGIDSRVVEEYRTRVPVTEVSLGDYVLNGGEVAALVVVEAVARLLPGVVGNPQSLVEESHGDAGLLEYPVYTRPVEWRGRAVPPELLSGHHAQIARWRRGEALRRTAGQRPDLLARLDPHRLDGADLRLLAELGWAPRDGRLSPDGEEHRGPDAEGRPGPGA